MQGIPIRRHRPKMVRKYVISLFLIVFNLLVL